MANFHITRISKNKKTGPIPVTTTSKESCPTTCLLIDAGCYADLGPIGSHWKKVSAGEKRAIDEDTFLSAIKALPKKQLWRHNQAGDLLQSTPGVIDVGFLGRLVKANKNKAGFTYTHHLLTPSNVQAIRSANAAGFTVNHSANTKHEAVAAFKEFGLPTVTILAMDAPNVEVIEGVKVVACPAEKSDQVNCSNCELCAKPARNYVIGFRAHGTRKAKANLIAVG